MSQISSTTCCLLMTQILFIASHRNIDELLNLIINNDLQKIAEWFQTEKLALNLDRSDLILFHPNAKI